MGSRTTPGWSEGRRERNKQRIRDDIYDAAVFLFMENGYGNTTVDEIARAANVARGTFFNHYQRKEDLINEWISKRREATAALFALGTTVEFRDTRSRLAFCMTALAHVNEQERGVTATMLQAWAQAGKVLSDPKPTTNVFTEVMSAGQMAGEVRPNIDVEVAGQALFDAYLGSLFRWAKEQPASGALASELCSIVDIYVCGIVINEKAVGF